MEFNFGGNSKFEKLRLLSDVTIDSNRSMTRIAPQSHEFSSAATFSTQLVNFIFKQLDNIKYSVIEAMRDIDNYHETAELEEGQLQ